MSTVGSIIKEYPPQEHQLSHDSRPLAAGVSAVRQRIKDDAIKTTSKPTKVQHLGAFLRFHKFFLPDSKWCCVLRRWLHWTPCWNTAGFKTNDKCESSLNYFSFLSLNKDHHDLYTYSLVMVASDMHVNMVVVTYVENTLVQIAMFGCTLKKVMTVLAKLAIVYTDFLLLFFLRLSAFHRRNIWEI